MQFDFREKKVIILGIQGSGKTHFAKKLLSTFSRPFVYRVTSDYDYMETPTLVFKPTDKYLDLDLFLITGKRLGSQKKIDALVLDELDLFTTESRLEQGELNEWVLLHRHNNAAFVGISRRPQDIPGKVFESAHYVINFALDAPACTRKFCDLHADYEHLLPMLSIEKHNFIVKEVGKPPVLFDAI